MQRAQRPPRIGPGDRNAFLNESMWKTAGFVWITGINHAQLQFSYGLWWLTMINIKHYFFSVASFQTNRYYHCSASLLMSPGVRTLQDSFAEIFQSCINMYTAALSCMSSQLAPQKVLGTNLPRTVPQLANGWKGLQTHKHRGRLKGVWSPHLWGQFRVPGIWCDPLMSL